MGEADDLIAHFQNLVTRRWQHRGLGGVERAKLEGREDQNKNAERLLGEIYLAAHHRLIFINARELDHIRTLHKQGIRTVGERAWVEQFYKEKKVIDFFWKKP
jgi:hypothetical protein